MPFGFHAPELIIVLVVALLVFGPKRLPEMGSAVGKTFKAFQQSMKEATDSMSVAPPVEPTPLTITPPVELDPQTHSSRE